MNRTLRAVTYVVLCGFLTSCAQKKVAEESYAPSREVVRVKSDTPIVKLWDRWNERSDGHVLVGGKDVVSGMHLPALLADDPSPEVVSKAKSAETWRVVGAASVGIAGLSAIVAALGHSKNEKGERSFGTAALNSLWVTTGIAASLGIVSLTISSSLLDDAQSMHNDRIWKQAGASSASSRKVEFAVKVTF